MCDKCGISYRFKKCNMFSIAGCTYGWSSYPGTNAPGLTQQGSPNSYTQASCQAACIAATWCQSIDFNTQDLTCWFGSTANSSKVSNSPVNHFDLSRSCGIICSYISQFYLTELATRIII